MCGYCFENWLLLEGLSSRRDEAVAETGTPFLRNIAAAVLLQEEEPLLPFLDQAARWGNPSFQLDIIFCRLFEHCLFLGVDRSLVRKINSLYGPDAAATFLHNRNHTVLAVHWIAIFTPAAFADEDKWRRFLWTASARLADLTYDTLEFYVDWWLRGRGKTTSDGADRLEQTGRMDPIDNTPKQEWDYFYAIFPWVYFSLMYIGRYCPNAPLIEQIALHPPQDVPDFPGHDLWLQRRAFLFYLQSAGWPGLLKHPDQIRFALVEYGLRKYKPFRRQTASALAWLRANQDRFPFWDENDRQFLAEMTS